MRASAENKRVNAVFYYLKGNHEAPKQPVFMLFLRLFEHFSRIYTNALVQRRVLA
jgi:hypothetical protein